MVINEDDDFDFGFTFEDEVAVTEELVQDIQETVKQDVKTLERLILPLLTNLQRNPEQEYIKWPNRVDIIQQQIDKIKKVTKKYE